MILTWNGRHREWTVTLKHNPGLSRAFQDNIVPYFKDQRRNAILRAQRVAFVDHPDLDIDKDPSSTDKKLCDRLPDKAQRLEDHVLTKFAVDDAAASQTGFELMMFPLFQLETRLQLALPFFPASLLGCIRLFCFWPVDGCL